MILAAASRMCIPAGGTDRYRRQELGGGSGGWGVGGDQPLQAGTEGRHQDLQLQRWLRCWHNTDSARS